MTSSHCDGAPESAGDRSEAKRETSDHTPTEPLGVGDQAPDFMLPGVYNGEIQQYTLSEYTATGPVVLGVYVFDFSPVCSTQMCQLTDMDWYQYKSKLTLFGICTDGPYSHMRFAEEEDLTFPLLSDTTGEVLT